MFWAIRSLDLMLVGSTKLVLFDGIGVVLDEFNILVFMTSVGIMILCVFMYALKFGIKVRMWVIWGVSIASKMETNDFIFTVRITFEVVIVMKRIGIMVLVVLMPFAFLMISRLIIIMHGIVFAVLWLLN